jgi:HTH-type transcriptional regulator, sugar sensing transcriptional regulator
MEEKNKILHEIGLSNWESRVYEALIKIGESKTGQIVEESRVPQSKIYVVLSQLQTKGLVSYITKGKIKFFQAENPEKIHLIFKEKEKEIRKEIERLNKIKNLIPLESSVRLFEGMKAIRLINSEIIQKSKSGKEFFGYSEGIGYSEEINEFYHQFGNLRRKTGMKDYLLISKKNKEEFEKGVSTEDLQYVRKKTRYCDVSFPQDTGIFEEEVIIYSWEDIPKAILIKNKKIADNYKEFFLDLWKQAKP